MTAFTRDNGDGFEFTELGITMETVEIPARAMPVRQENVIH